MTDDKPLSIEQQWMLNFLNSHLNNWNDVRTEALKTLKKVRTSQDFIDWSEYFLPKRRRDEVQQALIAFKLRHSSTADSEQKTRRTVAVPIDEQVARLLQRKARAANCSISELLMRNLA
ncbi:MAG: hypothetical protein P8X89_13800 [Reinekea sp.]|jgi:hypothetical protein